MAHPKSKEPKILTEAEQRAMLKLELYSNAEIKALAFPSEGFERVAPTVLDKLSGHLDLVSALKIDLAHLKAQVEEARVLGDAERRAEALYRRAKENRMANESDVYRALLKVNRIVQNAGDPELEIEFKDLGEWVAGSHEGGSGPGNPPGGPTGQK